MCGSSIGLPVMSKVASILNDYNDMIGLLVCFSSCISSIYLIQYQRV